MQSLKPSLVIQPLVVSQSYVQGMRLESKPTSSHVHTSFFRSFHLDMLIYSSSVKVVKHSGLAILQSCPVFGDQDKIEGKVILDSSCPQNGRLTISLEGTFEYLSVRDNADDDGPRKPTVRKHQHVFLSSSATIRISPIPESRSTIRDALTVRKRPSASSLNSSVCRSCEFSFEPPRGSRTGSELPLTFSSKNFRRADPRGQPGLEETEVAYRITAVWEPLDESGKQAMVEAPVVFQPDTDFQSVDGFNVASESWMEVPLFPERPIPFNCAVTLPHPQSFSRCNPIPYFVVFTTNTRSPSLIKEIAADATIVVSLIRKLSITPQRTLPLPIPTLPDTPPASDDSDNQAPPLTPRYGLLKRSLKTPTRSHSRDKLFSQTKQPLEQPQEILSVTQILRTELFIGFPKRPRANGAPHVLPDGLYKGKVQLSKDMLPTMDWPGVSVKYYLDVSVLFGQDDVRAHIPIKIY